MSSKDADVSMISCTPHDKITKEPMQPIKGSKNLADGTLEAMTRAMITFQSFHKDLHSDDMIPKETSLKPLTNTETKASARTCTTAARKLLSSSNFFLDGCA